MVTTPHPVCIVYQTQYPVYHTTMARILGVLLLSVLAGALLASSLGDWPLRPGLIGLGVMIASAWVARRYWQSLRPEDGPGSPERGLWHGLASYGLLTGHIGMFMWRLGPGSTCTALSGMPWQSTTGPW